jgi:5-methylthioadenosine/S-adenosylhomocysteine deaminase
MSTSTMIRGGRLLDPAARAAPPADILIIDGAIAAVGPPGMAGPADAQPFDAAGTLMHAGMVNCHTHGCTNFAKGTHDRWTLELLLNAPGEWIDNQTRENKYLNTYLGAIELLSKGCTTAYDLTFGFPLASIEDMHAMAQAYIDAGMRAVIAPMLMDVSFYNAIPARLQAQLAATQMAGADAILAHLKQALHGWSHDRDRVRLGVAPTIPLFCSDELIVGCARLAREYGTVIQSHVAESKVQAVSALKRWGKSLTGCGSTTTTCAGWPITAHRWRTMPGATCGSAAASPTCGGCSNSACGLPSAPTARCARTIRTCTRRCATPRWCPMCAARTTADG